ncbi:hypothetical protein ACFYZ8_35705 [Streptomyces sp. NPDC001668]|uniref:hypothetical protein n=1 Tax=unclassified Streptomyces TaxID=2593676 RepID=UPI00369E27C6
MVLSNAFRHAVEERALLPRHPFLAVDWAVTNTAVANLGLGANTWKRSTTQPHALAKR